MGNLLSFKGGIHPLPKLHHGKFLTDKCPVEAMPPGATLSISCAQHIGAPSNPCVAVGDKVKMGQVIAEAGGFVSVPTHSSVSGTVKAIVKHPNVMGREVTHIVIENDFQDERDESIAPKDYTTMTPEEIRNVIRDAGCVGQGGAGFPTHVKLTLSPDAKVDSVVVNAAECEPFLTADHRLMVESPESVVGGLKIIMAAVSVHNGYIGVEVNKPDAIEALNKVNDSSEIKVCSLQVKYPQGSEKQLVDAVLGRQVPSGKLPAAAGVVIVNATTCASVYRAFTEGMPVIERIATVTGYVNEPKNLMVRVGTTVQDMIDYCGGVKDDAIELVSGGPMMGLTMADTSITTTKTTSGILAVGPEYTYAKKLSNCIHCGRCVNACPIHLLPCYISASAEQYDFEKAQKYNALDCISCGSCSYVCPARRDLAQAIKLAKDQIAAINRKKQQAK